MFNSGMTNFRSYLVLFFLMAFACCGFGCKGSNTQAIDKAQGPLPQKQKLSAHQTKLLMDVTGALGDMGFYWQALVENDFSIEPPSTLKVVDRTLERKRLLNSISDKKCRRLYKESQGGYLLNYLGSDCAVNIIVKETEESVVEEDDIKKSRLQIARDYEFKDSKVKSNLLNATLRGTLQIEDTKNQSQETQWHKVRLKVSGRSRTAAWFELQTSETLTNIKSLESESQRMTLQRIDSFAINQTYKVVLKKQIQHKDDVEVFRKFFMNDQAIRESTYISLMQAMDQQLGLHWYLKTWPDDF